MYNLCCTVVQERAYEYEYDDNALTEFPELLSSAVSELEVLYARPASSLARPGSIAWTEPCLQLRPCVDVHCIAPIGDCPALPYSSSFLLPEVGRAMARPASHEEEEEEAAELRRDGRRGCISSILLSDAHTVDRHAYHLSGRRRRPAVLVLVLQIRPHSESRRRRVGRVEAHGARGSSEKDSTGP